MRIELSTGQGDVAVLLDARPPDTRTTRPCGLVAYDGSEAFHARFGGQTYYHSVSGLSHRGWVPATAGVCPVPVYRVDVGRIYGPGYPLRHKGWDPQDIPQTWGRHIVVPVSYKDRCVDPRWPVVELDYWGPKMWHVDELVDVLMGEPPTTELMDVEWDIWQPAGNGRPVKYTVAAAARCSAWATSSYQRRQRIRDVLASRRGDELSWKGTQPWSELGRATPRHWVGLVAHTDQAGTVWAVKLRRGRAVAAVQAEQLDQDRELLQAMLPDGFAALAPDVVVGGGRVRGPRAAVPVEPHVELAIIHRGDVDRARQLLADVSPRPAAASATSGASAPGAITIEGQGAEA